MTSPPQPNQPSPDEPHGQQPASGDPRYPPPSPQPGPPQGQYPPAPQGQYGYGPPGQYGYPPQMPPAQPQKKRHTGRWILLGLLGVVILVCAVIALVAVGGSNDDKTSTSGSGNNGKNAAELNTPVRDGKFEFTVSNVKCGVKQVGSEPLTKDAQGQFCLVSMSVKNIGDVPQTMFDANQKAFGSDGATYAADTEAGLYANNQSAVFANEINPGNTVDGIVVFDIPSSGKIAKLELHDSAFSGGADVNVQ